MHASRSLDFINLMTYDMRVFGLLDMWLGYNAPLNGSSSDPLVYKVANMVGWFVCIYVFIYLRKYVSLCCRNMLSITG